MKLAGVLAQSSVVLLDKVPADLVLGGGRRVVVGTLGGVGRNRACGSKLLLVVGVAVCCHNDGLLRYKRAWVVFRVGDGLGLRSVVYRLGG